MEFDEFENLIKDGLSNLYDLAALERHPLVNEVFSVPDDYKKSRGQFLADLLIEAIDQLKPQKLDYDMNSAEWRPYIILYQRYVEGQNTQDLSRMLSIGERQLRRIQKRSIEALAYQLWDRNDIKSIGMHKNESSPMNGTEFSFTLEEIDLSDLISGVLQLMSSRFEEENIKTVYEPPQHLLTVSSDRIIIRQILIAVLNQILHIDDLDEIDILLESQNGTPEIVITAPGVRIEENFIFDNLQRKEKMIREWGQVLKIEMHERHQEMPASIEFRLVFQVERKKTILIVDDQEPALRMYKRYLANMPYQIMGLNEAPNVIMKAKEIQPVLILLDIMMPKVDGWELLQSLKLNEATRAIPVVVCSAWGEADLAKSLGAEGFLRKPITQRELLDKLNALGF